MNKDIIIKIATDFSRIPGARYPEEGDYSGQDISSDRGNPLRAFWKRDPDHALRQ